LLGISTETTFSFRRKVQGRKQKLNYFKYRADGLYDSQDEKNNSS
jgi:hypothetical protein